MTDVFSWSRTLVGAALAGLVAVPMAFADEAPLPKLGPNAIPIDHDHAYLQSHPAPDYWAFSPYVKPQFTSSACSIASVTAALNGLAGLPALAEQTVPTQPNVLERTGLPEWGTLSAEDGDGVTFDQLMQFTQAAADASGMSGLKVTSYKPGAENADTLAHLRAMLAENEKSADDVLLIYFNQGVVTGDWDGPHVSLIGAYDADQDRVLILEVDQEWYIPYWTPVPVLLQAMLRPAPADQGVLEGQTGGFVRIAR